MATIFGLLLLAPYLPGFTRGYCYSTPSGLGAKFRYYTFLTTDS